MTDRGWRLIIGVAIAMLLLVAPLGREVSPIRALIMSGAIALAFLPLIRKRDLFDLVYVTVAISGIVVVNVRAFTEPDPVWLAGVRAATIVLVVSEVLILAASYVRSVKELDRVLFTEATSAAFIVTLAGTGLYGGLQRWLDLPSVDLVAVPVFGLAVWGIAALVFRRRLT